MQKSNLLSAVGVAVVGAGLAVTSWVYAAEFSCKIPWHSDSDCGFPKFSIRGQEKLTVEVYSAKVDGKEITKEDKCPVFTILDVNNNSVLSTTPPLCAGKSDTYVNPNKEKELLVEIRVNSVLTKDVYIQARYTVGK
jgi:hypothetical protein